MLDLSKPIRKKGSKAPALYKGKLEGNVLFPYLVAWQYNYVLPKSGEQPAWTAKTYESEGGIAVDFENVPPKPIARWGILFKDGTCSLFHPAHTEQSVKEHVAKYHHDGARAIFMMEVNDDGTLKET